MGICVYPTIQTVPKKIASEPVVQSPRDRLMLFKAMTGDKQEDESSMGLAAMQCHTQRPSTNTQCKKGSLRPKRWFYLRKMNQKKAAKTMSQIPVRPMKKKALSQYWNKTGDSKIE